MTTEPTALELIEREVVRLCCCHGHLDGLSVEEMADLGAFCPTLAAFRRGMVEAGKVAVQTHRADMASGAFIGGPTYEALKKSFTGRQIAAEALREAARDAETALLDEMVPESVKQTDFIAWLRKRAAKVQSK